MSEIKKVIILQTDLKKDDILIDFCVDLIDFHIDMKRDHLKESE
jgi:hypothetical protein